MFAFADPEIIQLAKTEFVPACADDWYQRRRQDAEGAFWKKIYRQGPRSADAGTHQGIYAFTADGELLAYKNAGQDVKATRDQLAQALRKWEALPATRRKPGAIAIEDRGKLDPNYSRTPPDGGLILRVHARILDKKGDGYAKGTCDFAGGDRAARDFLWLTADDVKSLTSIRSEVGYSTRLPAKIAERILRFHLVDNTRGEPEAWKREQIRSSELKLTVISDTASGIELRLDGEARLATDANLEKAERGYEPKIAGRLRIAPDKSLDRFEVVAIGEHWGAATFTKKGERPGRGLLGITLALVDSRLPANRVAPQGVRDLDGYYGVGR